MSSFAVRVFEVEVPPAGNRLPQEVTKPPVELLGTVVDAIDEDRAKLAAAKALETRGYMVRSLSWTPGVKASDPNRLLAYVFKAPEPKPAPMLFEKKGKLR
jgi:hypothetical protein